jgi:hypothetical protein
MITEITYSKGQTLQLSQFEPTNIHYSAKAEVKEGDNIQAAYTELKSIVNELVRKDVVALKEAKKTNEELKFPE